MDILSQIMSRPVYLKRAVYNITTKVCIIVRERHPVVFDSVFDSSSYALLLTYWTFFEVIPYLSYKKNNVELSPTHDSNLTKISVYFTIEGQWCSPLWFGGVATN